MWRGEFVIVRKHRISLPTSSIRHSQTSESSSGKARHSPHGYRIASNAIADQAKRKRRESSEQANAEASASVDLEEVERRARLSTAVEKLPDDQRRVIVMRFADEKSIREIAAELGRSEGAVKQLQFRGLENLRNRLNEK